eukprot:tig00000215_g18660.t1
MAFVVALAGAAPTRRGVARAGPSGRACVDPASAQRHAPVQSRSFMGTRVVVRSAARRAARAAVFEGAACSARALAPPKNPELVSRIVDLLKHELPSMFEPGNSVDYSIYAQDVFFQDPLNKFNGIGKYRQNISFLQTFFKDSKLDLHDIYTDVTAGGEDVVVTRTSEYVLGPEGTVVRHIDKWDSLPGPTEGGLQDLLSEMFGAGSGAPLEGSAPGAGAVAQAPYTLLRRYPGFEEGARAPAWRLGPGGLRGGAGAEYGAFEVVRTAYTARPAGFSALDAYLHGNSMSGEGLPRSAPVIYAVPSDPASPAPKRMAYPVPAGASEPLDDDLEVVPVDFSRIAAIRFSGSATPEIVAARRRQLERMVKAAGLRAVEEPVLRFAQYDAVYSLPWTRRNEVWLRLEAD